jgi:hypothetical protein
VPPSEISCPDLSLVTDVTVTGELTETPVGRLNMAERTGTWPAESAILPLAATKPVTSRSGVCCALVTA